jgi:hypothetical protein
MRECRLAAGFLLLTFVLTVVTVARPAQAARATETKMAYASHSVHASYSVGEAVAPDLDASARGLTEAPRVWPWWRWYRMGVSPQFSYRQVVEAGRRRGRRAQRLEIRTRYRYVPRRVSRRVADVDVLITGIDVYQRGRFLGSIERIPPRIRRTRARIFRNRPARIDREIAVIGGGEYGYELLALRPGRVWHRPAVLAAARVNLRRGAAVPVRRSRLISSRRSRNFSPIPVLPTKLGQISTRLLRFDVSYYDDTRLGDNYDGPRWSYEGNRDDSFDRFDDRYDPRYDSYDDRFERRRREGFDNRFNDQSPDRFEPRDRPLKAPYDERYDWKNDGVNPPRSAPRSSPPDRRSPYRKGASPTTLFAENGRSPEKDSAPNRGSRAPTQDVDPRPSVPRPDARTARNAPPMTVSRSENASRSTNTRSTNTRSTNRRGSDRSDSATRRTPDTVTGRDTRTVGDGDDALTIKRETEIVRLDDYEE